MKKATQNTQNSAYLRGFSLVRVAKVELTAS